MAKKALADQTWHSFVAIFHIFLYTDLEFVISNERITCFHEFGIFDFLTFFFRFLNPIFFSNICQTELPLTSGV